MLFFILFNFNSVRWFSLISSLYCHFSRRTSRYTEIMNEWYFFCLFFVFCLCRKFSKSPIVYENRLFPLFGNKEMNFSANWKDRNRLNCSAFPYSHLSEIKLICEMESRNSLLGDCTRNVNALDQFASHTIFLLHVELHAITRMLRAT